MAATRAFRFALLALLLTGCGDDRVARRVETEAREAIAIGADRSEVERALGRLGFESTWDAESHSYLATRRVRGGFLLKREVLVEVRMDGTGRAESIEVRGGKMGLGL